jgi:hypothetical protein
MQWMVREIGLGLAKLLCLRLAGCPSEDMVEATVAAWIDALALGRQWDQERDTPRIRHAFRVLCASRTEWPAPKDLVEALPASEQKQLPRSTGIPATKEEREANLERLRML